MGCISPPKPCNHREMQRADFDSQLPTHLPALRALARRMVGNRDDAEDLVQEVLLRASKGLAEFRGESALKTWLFSIVTRAAIDHLLRAAKRWTSSSLRGHARGAVAVGEQFAVFVGEVRRPPAHRILLHLHRPHARARRPRRARAQRGLPARERRGGPGARHHRAEVPPRAGGGPRGDAHRI